MEYFIRMFALTSTILITVKVSSASESYKNFGVSEGIKRRDTNGTSNTTSWRDGYEGHGTTHEQIGQLHWAMPEYTPYVFKANYSNEPAALSKALIPIYNFTHFLFRIFLTDTKDLPVGYVMVKDRDTLHLGPKFEKNEWEDLLAKYWLLLFIIILLLVCIILFPFIAVCYCCLCCCRRCKQGCPPCTATTDYRRRCFCGIFLFLLILCLIFGLVLAFVANKLLDRGFEEASTEMRRATQDTCMFLKETADHIHHIMVNNYQELETHLIYQLEIAHQHIFMDLADTSEVNALAELERILDNMPKALELMRRVSKLESSIRFINSQYRDGYRVTTRSLSWDLHFSCKMRVCEDYYRYVLIPFSLGKTKCFHIDELPDTSYYVEAMKEIVQGPYIDIPKKGLARLQKIDVLIRNQMNNVIPIFKRDLKKGHESIIAEATNLRNIIDAVISDIHLNTLHSAKTYDDVYERFGPDRRIFSIVVFVLLIFIVIFLIIALLCGCLGASRVSPGPSGFCSKSLGASCLLIAILLIFCVFSFVALVGLFYLILGIITYKGACTQLKSETNNEVLQNLNADIDLNRYLPAEELNLPPLRTAKVMEACQAHENIFQLLKRARLYDIDDLKRIKVFSKIDEVKPFEEDLSNMELLTIDEKSDLNKMRNGNLATYHSALYHENVCTNYGKTLSKLESEVKDWVWETNVQTEVLDYFMRINLRNSQLHGANIHKYFYQKLLNSIKELKNQVDAVDSQILYENHDFNSSIFILLNSIIESENFLQSRGKTFINTLVNNLTMELNEMYENFIHKVIRECTETVGRCEPLSYIYDRSVHYICERLVDPINAFWLGLLLCTVFLLPTLFVAHRLMCLYLKIYPVTYACGPVAVSNCPICTGAPYTPPVIYACGGGQQAYCGCNTDTRKAGGFNAGLTAPSSSFGNNPNGNVMDQTLTRKSKNE